MFVSFLASFFLFAAAQGSAYAPPEIARPPAATCRCESAADEADLVVFIGVAADAEIRADETGRNPARRQATIFRAVRVRAGEAENPAYVWHATDREACGLSFDYGRQYTVRARRSEDGLETDACLMRLGPSLAE